MESAWPSKSRTLACVSIPFRSSGVREENSERRGGRSSGLDTAPQDDVDASDKGRDDVPSSRGPVHLPARKPHEGCISPGLPMDSKASISDLISDLMGVEIGGNRDELCNDRFSGLPPIGEKHEMEPHICPIAGRDPIAKTL